uniref:Stress response regulator protein 1 n=1 Tax=Mycena chlorophos TaxID=658473 RepID=A0ABQ0KYQ2_MYCCL|nr:sensor histidine kinase [Mycena chlorophos]
MSHTTILLAEDNTSIRELVTESLQDEGFEVIAVDCGNRAADVLASEQTVDLLFSDIYMPGQLNGVQLASKGRALRPALKVLLTSGNPTRDFTPPEDLPFLPKPFGMGEMLRMVHQVLQHAR